MAAGNNRVTLAAGNSNISAADMLGTENDTVPKIVSFHQDLGMQSEGQLVNKYDIKIAESYWRVRQSLRLEESIL